MIGISGDQFHTLCHSLGLTRSKKVYRNYFAGSIADRRCEPLVEKGLMEKGKLYNNGSGQYYHVSTTGIEFVKRFIDVKE